MKTRLLPLLLILVFATAVSAAPIHYATHLSGPAESPPNSSPGTGSAKVTYDPATHLLTVEFNFANLLGDTTVGHIHCCVDPSGNVGVATFPGTFPGFPAGVTSGNYGPTSWDLTDLGSFTGSFVTNFGSGTVAGAEAALAAGLASGRAYLNIHSSMFPGGEIRGFLQPVPEPGTLVLLSLGGGALLARRRKR